MDHYVMRLVLNCVSELRRAKSREVAERLELEVKRVSSELSKCKHRRYVDREPYRRGREHGYVYWLTKRGADWLVKKAKLRKKRTSGLSQTSGPELKEPKNENMVLWFAMRENKELKRQNQELIVSLERAIWAYCKCSSERDFMLWKYLSSDSQFEGENENVVQSLVRLVKEKEETIRDLLRYISKSEKRSKLPERGFSKKSMEQIEFRSSSVVKKLSIKQSQKARVMSLGDCIIKGVYEKLAFRSWLTEMDQWHNWLPSPLGNWHMANIFCSVIKDATDEMKGVKKPRTIMKKYKGEYRLPTEILRLPD